MKRRRGPKEQHPNTIFCKKIIETMFPVWQPLTLNINNSPAKLFLSCIFTGLIYFTGFESTGLISSWREFSSKCNALQEFQEFPQIFGAYRTLCCDGIRTSYCTVIVVHVASFPKEVVLLKVDRRRLNAQ